MADADRGAAPYGGPGAAPDAGTDVLVVGGGTAGCVLAARLAEAGRSVRLLEAGDVTPPPELRSASSLAGSVPGHPATWSFPGHLTPSRPFTVPRGRVLGGSSAVNGAYFARGTPDDYGWAPGWSYADLLPYFRALETDHDFTGPAHGHAGPMPVTRPSGALLSPAAEAFLEACRALGHPAEPDRNAGGPPGAGPVPANVRDGVRVTTAAAYLPDHATRPARPATGAARPGGTATGPAWAAQTGGGPPRADLMATGPARADLTITARAVVRRVIVERGRAVGVEAEAAGERTVLRAEEVILAAGAINTAQLLLLSGIGPAADLRAHGIPVVHDVPVGAAFHDHPQIWVPYRTTRPLPVRPGMILTQAALDAGDAEILATGVPMSLALTGAAGTATELALIVSLQRPESRGRLTLASSDPAVPPRLEYHYLEPETDRERLAEAVRHGLELLRTPPLRNLVADVTTPEDLDAHLQTAFHLSGTAPIGAVTDPYGRVPGVDGLRVADTALIPAPMRRGPAATAVLIGERMAGLLS